MFRRPECQLTEAAPVAQNDSTAVLGYYINYHQGTREAKAYPHNMVRILVAQDSSTADSKIILPAGYNGSLHSTGF